MAVYGGRMSTGRPSATASTSHDSPARAEARTGRLIARLSHELRTPVTTIYGGSKLLNRSSPGVPDAARRELVAAVEVEAERLYRTIEDLLAIVGSEPDTGLLRQPVLLQRIAPPVLAREQERRPDVTIRALLPPDSPPVAGDEAALAQIIRNIVANAVRYSSPGTSVEVVLSSLRGCVALRVLDRGPGLDPAEIEPLFEPFYRSQRTAGGPAGAGLGLPASRRLASQLGGRVRARPRAGGGAEFRLELPAYGED
jgi:two-component system, OmpR family, sensor kinase